MLGNYTKARVECPEIQNDRVRSSNKFLRKREYAKRRASAASTNTEMDKHSLVMGKKPKHWYAKSDSVPSLVKIRLWKKVFAVPRIGKTSRCTMKKWPVSLEEKASYLL